MAGNTIALTKLLPLNLLSQQSPCAIATTTIVTRRCQPLPLSAKAALSTPPSRLVIAQACKNWSLMPRHHQPSATYAVAHSHAKDSHTTTMVALWLHRCCRCRCHRHCRHHRLPPPSCDLFDCCVFVCHRFLSPSSSGGGHPAPRIRQCRRHCGHRRCCRGRCCRRRCCRRRLRCCRRHLPPPPRNLFDCCLCVLVPHHVVSP
jgi:hypothetical protein